MRLGAWTRPTLGIRPRATRRGPRRRPPQPQARPPPTPGALGDLGGSGLDDATIIEAGLHTPAPRDLPRLLGPRLADQVRHVLVLPHGGTPPGGGAPHEGRT